MPATRRIYLDNAATTWPKPESVYRAVEVFVRENGAAPGRGGYRESLAAGQLVERARAGVARLLGVTDPRRVVFASNGTDALNLAIHGTLRPGDHVVTTVLEHNSVLRPLDELQRRGVIALSIVPCDWQGRVNPEDVAAACTAKTRLVAVNHASNVVGTCQDVSALVEAAHRHGALFLLDAAQSLGQVLIDAPQWGVDLLAAPGHKGLFGLMGTGLLYVAPGVEQQLTSRRQGGTGTVSEQLQHPAELPEKYEAGILNAPGLAALAAGVEFVERQGVAAFHERTSAWAAQLRAELSAMPGLCVLACDESVARTAVVSFTCDDFEPQEFAALLEASYGIQVRAGLHCAPLAHRAFGTLSQGGTVRLSASAMTSDEDSAAVVAALREITMTTAS